MCLFWLACGPPAGSSFFAHLRMPDIVSHAPVTAQGLQNAAACVCAKPAWPLPGLVVRRREQGGSLQDAHARVMRVLLLCFAVLAEEALTSLEGKSREAAALQGQLEERGLNVERLHSELGAFEQQAAGLTSKVPENPPVLSEPFCAGGRSDMQGAEIACSLWEVLWAVSCTAALAFSGLGLVC